HFRDNTDTPQPRGESSQPPVTCSACESRGAGRLEDLDVEIPDPATQRVAVETEQLCRPDLVATRCSQRRSDERLLHLTDDSVVKPRRRELVSVTGKIAAEVALDEL